MRRRFFNQKIKNSEYCTIEALEDGLILSSSLPIEYSIDGGNWETIRSGQNTKEINAGQKIFMKYYGSFSTSYNLSLSVNKQFNLLGNAGSLLLGYDNIDNISGWYFESLFANTPVKHVSKEFLYGLPITSSCFQSMFSGCTSLTTAPDLPATTLHYSCYDSMFKGCTSLVTAPELPATTLDSYCYYQMFSGCTSLTTAPELPATTLSYCCYTGMFSNCTSLTTAPELPATTLADKCYEHMFYDCSKLNYIKAMFTTTPSYTYTSHWVQGVASSGTFIKNSNATWSVVGVNGIPSGWTVRTA